MTEKPPSVTIVIPTLKEENAIGLVLQELYENGWNEVLVVDEGSDNRTVEIAKSMGAEVTV